jgi:hypothetical protein
MLLIVDACEHAVEPRELDQRIHHGGALTAAIGAGERP